MKKAYAFLSLFLTFLAGISISNAQCVTAPFSESFDTGLQPSCILISATSGGPWDFNGISWNTSGCPGAPLDHTGNNGDFASMDHSGTDAGVIMEFDTIDVSALTSPYLQFYYFMCGSGYSPVNILAVETFDGTAWVGVDTIQQGTSGWDLYAYDLSANTFGTGFLKVRFRAESGGAGTDFYGDQAIDDISVTELPTCFVPTSPVLTSFTLTTADIGWTENNAATTWEIDYDTAGYTPGTGNRLVTTSNPVTLTGLSNFTSYEWYVRSICGVGDTSAWTAGPSFFTGYCTPAPTSVDGSGITNVTFGTVNNTTGAEPGNYGDYSNLVGDAPQGLTVPLDITFSTGLTYNTEVYIDWNNDLDFDDTLENVYSGVSAAANPTTLNASFSVPAGQALGQYRMRIGGADFANPTPCYNGSWASFEDYTVNVVAPPACVFPNTLASSVSNDSALVSWSDPNAATQWEVEWDTVGYTLGAAANSAIVNNDTFLLITGLNFTTAYSWAVRAICGPADTSSWAAGPGFTTPIAGPQGLTCTTGNPSVVFSDDLETTGGWTGNIGTGANNWVYDANGTPSSGTGPLAAYSGNQYVFVETSGAGIGTPVSFISPAIDLTTGNNSAELSFWLHAFGGNIGTLNVGVGFSATGPFTNVFSVSGQQQATQASPWINAGINLDAYVGQTIYIEFLYLTNGSFRGDIALDLIEVSTCVACAAPSAPSASYLDTDSLIMNWTENGTATNWQVSYGPTPTAAGAGTIVATTADSVNVGGLMAGTSYDFYVRSVCGAGDTSIWSPIGTAQTLFGLPYNQDFEAFPLNQNIGSEGWSNSRGTTAPDWTTATSTTSTGTGPTQDHTIGTGGKFVYLETSGGAAGFVDTLRSPTIRVGASQNNLTFQYWYHMHGATMGEMQVWIEAGGIWDSITSYVGQQQVAQGDPWLLGTHNLTTYAGQDVTIYFLGIRGTSFTGDLAVDDVRLIETPNCLPPSNLGDTLSTLTSVQLSWTENNSATNWDVEYGPAGFTPGTGTTVNTSSNPYTLTGLNPSTTYDFYVTSNCGPGNSSPQSFSASFSTLNGVPYFQDFEGFSTGAFVNDEGWFNINAGTNPQFQIGSFTTSGGTGPAADHTIGAGGLFAYLETSAPSSAGQTDTLVSAPIVVGSSQNIIELSYWYHMHGATIGQLQAWVVTSGGVFTLINTINGQQQPNQADPWLESVNILSGYADSTIRIAFVGVAGSSFTGDLAVDDVSLDLPPSDDIGVTNILGPVSGCGLGAADSVTVEITNFGIAAQSNFSIGYSLNGVAIVPETVTSSLGAGMTMNYTFATTANLSTSGAYDIVAYTSLTNDADSTNDTSSVTINSYAFVSSFPYSESFESGPADWTVSGITSFELGAPINAIIDTASDGTQAWVTDLDANYGDNEAGAVVSPCFDFTNVADPYIELDIWWDIETSWDGAVMQASTDGGATWTKVGDFLDTVNWYNDNTIDALVASLEPSGEGWTGTPGSSGWVTAKHYLDGFGGSPAVQIRIAFASDVTVNEEGFAFDNVNIYDRPVPTPYYPIGVINTVDSNGVADSLNVEVRTSGTVVGIDLDGNNGYLFSIVDMSTSTQEGIAVFSFSDVSGYQATEGDSIMVWGDVAQFNGLQEIIPDSIAIISTGRPVPAPIITNSPNESTESRWIELGSDFVMLDPSGTGGGSYNMDATNGTDTITIRVDSDTEVHDSLRVSTNALVVGDTICLMRGTGGQFDGSNPYTSGYQIFPIYYSDVTICRLSTGINEVENESAQLTIFPNPTNDIVTIKANNITSNDARIMVRDLSGKIMFENRINKSEFSTTLDLSDRANGIYFITIIDGDKMIHEKLIKN